MRAQLTIEQLAALAEVDETAVRRAEDGDGINDVSLRALCNTLRVELVLRRIG